MSWLRADEVIHVGCVGVAIARYVGRERAILRACTAWDTRWVTAVSQSGVPQKLYAAPLRLLAPPSSLRDTGS